MVKVSKFKQYVKKKRSIIANRLVALTFKKANKYKTYLQLQHVQRI